jgi:hypothetical protein
MRARRRFQPLLDSMPSRIAPSAVGGMTPPVANHAAAVAHHTSTAPSFRVDDTNMPQIGTSTPKR